MDSFRAPSHRTLTLIGAWSTSDLECSFRLCPASGQRGAPDDSGHMTDRAVGAVIHAGTRFGVFGTGSVGRTLAAKLADVGHAVIVGTRDPEQTLLRSQPDSMGNPPFAAWLEDHPTVRLGTMDEAAAHGEILVNAMNGVGSVAALKTIAEANLDGKVLMDVANPLDFSKGMPPSLTICNTDSLGEQIQRAFPGARVVKTLNTLNAQMMVQPQILASKQHTVFVSGNDTTAKAQVTAVLRSFGWEDIIDLGDITTARGVEMVLPLWVRLWGALKTPHFSLSVVR